MAEYLRYIVKNIDPVRVADDAVSQSGQTDTLNYIPGSAVRGMVINAFASRENLDENVGLKKTLFSDNTVFTNAYLTTKKHTLIPSPKGFYEDKTVVRGVKRLSSNVAIDGKSEPGTKRASIGRYCYIDGGCINYYSVKTGSDLKIKINNETNGKSEMFRCEYIAPNQYFEGFIKLTGTNADNTICEVFAKDSTVILGNSRSSGLGKCKVVLSEKTNTIPYQGQCFDATSECYIELLSDLIPRGSNGEICGFNQDICDSLANKLGVENLSVKFCSTSTRTINGYNRTWKNRLPSMLAYEQGSVFHLSYSGTITPSAMEKMTNEGMGIRKNEGFGRILFLKDYEGVDSKLSREYSYDENADYCRACEQLTADDKETLRIVARGYYINLINRKMEEFIVKNPIKKGGISNSQLGSVEAILSATRYDPKTAREKIVEYFEHTMSKEQNQKTQKSRASIQSLKNQVMKEIMDRGISDILFKDEKPEAIMNIAVPDVLSKTEEESIKIRLLIRMIRYSYKEV